MTGRGLTAVTDKGSRRNSRTSGGVGGNKVAVAVVVVAIVAVAVVVHKGPQQTPPLYVLGLRVIV